MRKKAEDGLAKQQQAYSNLLENRDKALKKKCSKCKGQLITKDLCTVQCTKCKKDFFVSDILKSAS